MEKAWFAEHGFGPGKAVIVEERTEHGWKVYIRESTAEEAERARPAHNIGINIKWSVVNEMLACAESWEPDARLIGNVRAGDIAEVCRAVIAEGQKHFQKEGADGHSNLCSE